MWQSLVIALIREFGPLLKEWLRAILDRKAAEFEAAGKERSAVEPDAAALLRAARGELWFYEVRKRRLLDRYIAELPPALGAGKPLPAGTLAELRAMAAVA